MRNYSSTKCLLAWIVLLGTSSDGDRSTIVDGAATRAANIHNYDYVESNEIHVRQKALHTTYNLSSLTETDLLPAVARTHLYWNDQGHTETALELLQNRLRYVFGSTSKRRRRAVKSTKFWIKPEPFRISKVRQLENAYDDDKYQYDDDDKNYDDDGRNAGGNDDTDDLVSAADERCSAFLVSFLEGTTDAHDTCEGMMNAYVAAGTIRPLWTQLFSSRISFLLTSRRSSLTNCVYLTIIVKTAPLQIKSTTRIMTMMITSTNLQSMSVARR